MPFVTRVTTSSVSGLASSRFGPTVPVAPASARVWQPTQPALVKTALPAVGSPCELEGGKVARVRRRGRQRADDGVRGGGRLGAVEAAGAEQAERKREQNEGNDSVSGASRLGV